MKTKTKISKKISKVFDIILVNCPGTAILSIILTAIAAISVAGYGTYLFFTYVIGLGDNYSFVDWVLYGLLFWIVIMAVYYFVRFLIKEIRKIKCIFQCCNLPLNDKELIKHSISSAKEYTDYIKKITKLLKDLSDLDWFSIIKQLISYKDFESSMLNGTLAPIPNTNNDLILFVTKYNNKYAICATAESRPDELLCVKGYVPLFSYDILDLSKKQIIGRCWTSDVEIIYRESEKTHAVKE